eukprot:TRINITY_DN31265_c0_g1_i1.p1 TRINITY_DN31265_c0_g1~~TRINITY_DN31265_c0_g1_i1.p1  ORF type:complete len:458 (+),score=0.35 TRINITY_DN31265_c0_g1_i1:48-1421(+)
MLLRPSGSSPPNFPLFRRVAAFILPLLLIAAFLKWTILPWSDFDSSTPVALPGVSPATAKRRELDAVRAAAAVHGFEHLGSDVSAVGADCRFLAKRSAASFADCASGCNEQEGCSVINFDSLTPECLYYSCSNSYAPVLSERLGWHTYRRVPERNWELVAEQPFDNSRLLLLGTDQVASGNDCPSAGTGPMESLDACGAACDASPDCNAFNFYPSSKKCIFRKCTTPATPVLSTLKGWTVYTILPEPLDISKHVPLQLPVDFVSYPRELSPLPRIIHQIEIGSSLLPKDKLFRMGHIADLHPGWALWVWRDEHITKDNFVQFDVISDSAFPLNAKLNLMMFEILLRHGGVFLNSSMELSRSLEPLIAGSESLVISSDDPSKSVNLHFLAALPQNSVLQHCVSSATGPNNSELSDGSSYFLKNFVLDQAVKVWPDVFPVCSTVEDCKPTNSTFGVLHV